MKLLRHGCGYVSGSDYTRATWQLYTLPDNSHNMFLVLVWPIGNCIFASLSMNPASFTPLCSV